MPDKPGTTASASADDRTLWRIRLLTGCLLLVALAFRQAGGLVVPDTKLDLTADPGAFLRRALHLWDPQGAMGQLQNQAYGYLIPSGPFHWSLIELGLPPWVVQRLWWSLLLVVAFLGVWKLATILDIGSPWARYVAALMYAVSPRLLGEVAITSVEVWPIAMAPWILVPLVGLRHRSWLHRAALSSLVVVLVGGVNAVATGATLVLPALYLLTLAPRREAIRRFGVWLALVTMASLWWLLPLGLLGRYSPHFLDWIENAPITTAFASPFNALSGTTPWLGFLSGPAGPSWPAGWAFVTNPALVVMAVVVAGLGLSGLLALRAEIRAMLGLGLVTGLVLVALGHTGIASGPLGQVVQAFLDGAGAPLRNTHKFELLVRLPLALGLAHALTAIHHRLQRLDVPSWLIRVGVACMVTMLAAPGISGLLARPEGYAAIPSYWRDAARWLDDHASDGVTMSVPSASFGDFVWGSTKDDPLQALSGQRFVSRDAVPLGSAGTTRWLDDIEQRLRSGQGDAALARSLQIGGIQHILVRNDLRSDAIDGPDGTLVRVHQALGDAGFTRVASFGPALGSPPGLPQEAPDTTVDQRSRLPYPVLEVFALPASPAAQLVNANSMALVSGGPEDAGRALAALPDASVAVVGDDAAALPDGLRKVAPLVLTDGNQRREAFFGRSSDNRSQVLTIDDPGHTGRSVNDYVWSQTTSQTVAQWLPPLARVVASSSAADANATLRLGPGYGPAALIDGDVTTQWVSGNYGEAAGEWIELDFVRPLDAPSILVTPGAPGAVQPATALRIDTDAGTRTVSLLPGPFAQPVALPSGPTQRIRLTVENVLPEHSGGVGLAEVQLPGTVLGMQRVVPSPGRTPDVLAVATDVGRASCSWAVDRPVCLPATGRQAEESAGFTRLVDLPSSLGVTMRGTVRARPGPAADALLDGLSPVRVTASSSASAEPAARPASVVDGELGTGWIAGTGDLKPTLTLTLPPGASVGRLQVLRDQYLPASMPTKVSVSLDDGPQRSLTVDREGWVDFGAAASATISLTFDDWTPLTSIHSTSGFPTTLPVGVSEVVLPGVTGLGHRDLSAATGATCGFGPTLKIGDRAWPTEVSGTLEDLLSGRPLAWRSCSGDQLTVPTGRVDIGAAATAQFTPTSLELATTATRAPGHSSQISVRRDSPVQLTADLATVHDDSLLVIAQNFNTGWSARDASGAELKPVRANGWQQAWFVPAGTRGTVVAEFGPDRPYRLGLLVGAGGVLAVAVLALVTRRGSSTGDPTETRVPRILVAGFVGVLVLSTGWVGVVALLVGGLALVLLGEKSLPPIVLAAAAAAGLVVVSAPTWPATRASVDQGLVQVLALVAVVMSVLPVLAPKVVRQRIRLPRRMIGRSKK